MSRSGVTLQTACPIWFRADGNSRIGMGHIIRCLALAQMLGDSFRRYLAVVQPAPELVDQAEAAGLTVVSLPDDRIEALTSKISPECVLVLDGYSFDEVYQRNCRQHARYLVYIDDLCRGHQVADILINHAGGISAEAYEAEPYTMFLLGPHYTLLRPEFLRPTDSGPAPSEKTIFVSLGGADPQNHSLRVLQAFEQVPGYPLVRLVLGPFHPDRPAIEVFATRYPEITILANLTARQMADEIRRCTMAITACSTVAYEVCAIGRPFIGLQTADNQQQLRHFFDQEKLAIATLDADASPDTIAQAIQRALTQPDLTTATLTNQHRYFDGQAPERFRQLFHRLCSPAA